MYPINECPGYYVNEKGEVFSCVKKNFKVKLGCESYIDETNPIMLKSHPHHTNGYVYVTLGRFGRKRLHRIVAETFINNPHNLPEVNHIDEDKTNNNVSNLEWCSRQYNAQHSLSKHYIVENIHTKERLEVFNLSAFCREKSLSVGSLKETELQQKRKQHKGWKVVSLV